jgi:predicted metal-dependent hydrolase
VIRLPRLRGRRAPLPASVEVALETGAVTVEVRSPARALRYSLRVPSVGKAPVLTVPPHGELAEALDFLDRHRPWLAQRLARRPVEIPFVEGSVVPIGGVDHVIRHSGHVRGAVRVEPGEADAPPSIVVSGRPEFLARRVTAHLKDLAERELVAASRRHAEALGVKFGRVTIKDTRSRWGSCTANGDLAYSWRIILAPPAVLDYLAAHEVAHLVELNHSQRFWRLVARLCPAWRRERDWLRRHGNQLHRYGGA